MEMKGELFNTEMELIEDLGRMYPNLKCKQKARFGLYKCPICGLAYKTRTATVKNGSSTKCRSCSVVIIKTTHHETKTRLYNIWARMKYRCENNKIPAYKWYGGKGVSVCEEWNKSYIKFRDWSLNNGYREDLVLDKDILCEKNNIIPKIYSPETCVWITVTENSKECNERRKNDKL